MTPVPDWVPHWVRTLVYALVVITIIYKAAPGIRALFRALRHFGDLLEVLWSIDTRLAALNAAFGRETDRMDRQERRFDDLTRDLAEHSRQSTEGLAELGGKVQVLADTFAEHLTTHHAPPEDTDG